ncbi:RidA family protein [Nocardia goodfellowii]|nr:RidA family protein [Nocardia goodfellowii]
MPCSATADRINIGDGSVYEQEIGYSRAVRIGNTVAVSGTTAALPDGQAVGGEDIGAQTREALRRIASALSRAGAGTEDVVRTRVLLTDITRWPEVAEEYSKVFGNVRPTCTLYEVSALISPSLLVEIEVDAFIEGNTRAR